MLVDTPKLLDKNSYFQMLLNETLDLDNLNFLNSKKDGKYYVDADRSKVEEFFVEIDCPFGDGFFSIKFEIAVNIIEAKFKGSYELPPDPDEAEFLLEVVEAYFYDTDGQEYAINLSGFHRLKELITKVEDNLICS
jgi:hypothetical protein